MRIVTQSLERGIALIIVMVTILVLAALAGGFAYAMKVETRLARNAHSESELEWLGRSGVELARYVLAQQAIKGEPYDALYQKWAGGPGVLGNAISPLSDISLDNVRLGRGKFSVKIVDQERKFNLNIADPPMLQQAMTAMGVDAGAASSVVDSILDWRDSDNLSHVNGWESMEYLSQMDRPPYSAKNGPIDDLVELMLIHGITPAIYAGGVDSLHPSVSYSQSAFGPNGPAPVSYPVGLKDLFCVVGDARININTASAWVLQLIPGIDARQAQDIIARRAGEDGVDGTADDIPFANTGEVAMNVPGLGPPWAQVLARYCFVRSFTFEAQVDVEIDQYKRRFVALLRRNNPRDVQVLNVHWE